MTGIDPEGLDLRLDGETARLDFDRTVLTPAQARAVLVELAQAARKVQSN
jgi:putative heme iron utilization protein